MTRPDFSAHRSWQIDVADAARAVDIYLEQVAPTDGPYWFDTKTAEAAVAFFPKFCRLTKGEWMGKPFKLSGWQALDGIIPLFGWKRANGTRRYRTFRDWEPRKNGKTEKVAGLSHLLLLGDGEGGAEGYALASDKSQAGIVFAASQTMIPFSPALSKHLEPLATATWCAALHGSFKPLSGKPDGKHGFNPSFSIGDELHEWKSGDLLTFVRQGMGTRRQPLDIGISTAGVSQGFGYEEYQRNLAIYNGVYDDPETLVTIYAADPRDDWKDPATWAKANPNLGVSLKLEFLEAECRRAQQSPRLENAFKNYHLNLWTQQAVRWLSTDHWKQCVDGDPKQAWRTLWERLRGRRCFIGGDLATTTDIAAVVLVFPPCAGDHLWRLVPRFFVPEDTVRDRVEKDKVPYDVWIAAGALEATPGNIVDQDRIKEVILEAADAFVVEKIGFDRWQAAKLGTELLKEGAPVVWYPQSIAGFAAPCKELERLHITHGLDHGGQPLLAWMAANVAVAKDGNDNMKPMKNKSTEKIDGIVAALMGMGLAINDLPEDPGESYTQTQHMAVLE